jgi:hypothetical protein
VLVEKAAKPILQVKGDTMARGVEGDSFKDEPDVAGMGLCEVLHLSDSSKMPWHFRWAFSYWLKTHQFRTPLSLDPARRMCGWKELVET